MMSPDFNMSSICQLWHGVGIAVLRCTGVYFNVPTWKELCDRYYMAAPAQRRQGGAQYRSTK